MIATTVDSCATQYYLNNYLQGSKSDPELDPEIDLKTIAIVKIVLEMIESGNID